MIFLLPVGGASRAGLCGHDTIRRVRGHAEALHCGGLRIQGDGPAHFEAGLDLQRAIRVVGYGPESAADGGRPALVEFITREETQLSKPW